MANIVLPGDEPQTAAPSFWQRVREAWRIWPPATRCRPRPVGLPDDGVTRPLGSAGGQRPRFRHAGRGVPRRAVGVAGRTLCPAHREPDVGLCVRRRHHGVERQAGRAEFLDAFWLHPETGSICARWSGARKLSWSGELFVALFPDETTRMVMCGRLRPTASTRSSGGRRPMKRRRNSMRYRIQSMTPDGRWWNAPRADPAGVRSLVLHYAVNRPVGALRGESDLAAVLAAQTLLRMARRPRCGSTPPCAFLWIVYAPGRRWPSCRRSTAARPPTARSSSPR